ncbi:hypothetical protein EJB05_56697, partial [Eragrostis curvula]
MALQSMDLPGLDFRPGVGVQSAILDRLDSHLNFKPGSGQSEFLLVVSFGRCVFRLTEETVSLILQATIGGVAADFRPAQLDDRVFRFSVSSKAVGFHIYNLKSFECKQYKLHFHLWGSGGASWSQESINFNKEEEDSWTTVKRKGRKKSYVDAVKNQNRVPLTGANKVPLMNRKMWKPKKSVFDRLSNPRQSVFDRIEEIIPEAKNKEPAVENSNFELTDGDQPASSRPIKLNTAQSVEFQDSGPSIIICKRCLKSGHHSKKCWGRIRCRLCSQEGHISFYCNSPPENKGFVPPKEVTDCFGKTEFFANTSTWFHEKETLSVGPSSSRPKIFLSFTDWVSHIKVKDTIGDGFSPSSSVSANPSPGSLKESNLSVNQVLDLNVAQNMNIVPVIPAGQYQDDQDAAFIPEELNENDIMELHDPLHQLQPLQQQPPIQHVPPLNQVNNELVAVNQPVEENQMGGGQDHIQSDRIKKKNKGFKGSHCTGKNCYACSADPPNLTPRDIKNLGETFCRIKPVALSEKAFNEVASNTSGAIGDKKPKSSQKKREKEKASQPKKSSNEDKTKKKPRK